MPRTRKVFWKRFSLFIFLEIIVIAISLYAWGFIGKIGASRFSTMVTCLRPQQKVQLAKALNFYYDHGFAKYSKGLVLKCDPETDSILKQFSWFHRNSISYYLTDTPDYHDILVSTVDYFDILDDDEAENLNSYRLETKLIYWQSEQDLQSTFTDKDKTDMLITLIDLGTSLFLTSSSPAGLTVSAIAFLSKAGSDPAKSLPAIIVFNKMRTNNLILSLLILSLANFIFVSFFIRKK